MLALTLFVVSARQRNVLLVPLAILGGVGAAEIITLARARNERALLAFGAVIIATALLGIEGRPMREHEYKWTGLAEPDSPEALFDRALILERRGAWPQADALLASIADYRPMRENRAVSSVAYYRAVAGLHLRVPPTVTRELLDRAEREAPGDPHVLALRAVTVDPDAARILDALHDPYTRDFAFALALNAIGEHDRARAMLDALSRRKPRGGAPVPSPAGPAAPSPPSTTDATGAAAPAGPPARASAFRRARLSQTTPQWFERSRAVEPASSSKPPLLRSTAGRFPRSVSSATL
jgi:hypothetical protein